MNLVYAPKEFSVVGHDIRADDLSESGHSRL
jgi:hypothetical protein